MLQTILSFLIVAASIAILIFVFNRKPHNQSLSSDELEENESDSEQNRINSFDTFDQLWDKLVPKIGSAETIQGELIRSIGRLSHDYYANAYANWGVEFQKSMDFLKSHLMDGTFDTSISKEIQSDIIEIEAYRRVSGKMSSDVSSVGNRVVEGQADGCWNPQGQLS
jgi:hypothetical protein